ncbi:hypothetical protein J3R82DRAFT_11538 [Butyriboletus roseoflavus]|nr:hypothetical protein J3R82DRAFT_11538 [Butyriboletus roseoflavus]
MARHSLLASTTPTNIAPADVTIGHVYVHFLSTCLLAGTLIPYLPSSSQLRDLIICPREPGLVNYVQGYSIVEHDLYAPDIPVRSIADLSFNPNTLASIQLPDSDTTLLAAGGQEAEIHLSLHQPSSRSQRREDPSPRLRCNNAIWQYYRKLHGSINNSVLLSSLSLTRSGESSVEPRLVVSNNDCTVRFYDVAVRGESSPKDLRQSGNLKLEEPINHSSISPDGRTLLSVGDSPRIYLHHFTGGPCITFAPIVTLNVPPPDARLYSPSLSASFSTAFSHDGMKFAVASQEGVVAVWDVRSTKPMKVIQTDKARLPVGHLGNGEESSMLSDDPWDWTRGNSKAPGWGARSVKFGAGGTHGRPGHEIMTFTEHTNLLHVIDARTFETEDIIRIPNVTGRDASRLTSSCPLSTSLAQPDATHLSATPPIRQIAQPPRAIRTVEESFHINSFPNSGPLATRRPPHRILRRRDGEDGEDYSYGDVLGLPPHGDSAVQENIREAFSRRAVRAYLAHRTDLYPQPAPRGTASPHVYGNNDVDGDGGGDMDSMDVDEPETECISRAPSRSSSPPPSIHLPLQTSPTPSRNTALARYSNNRHSSHASRRTTTRANFVAEQIQNPDLDIAGTCFDPRGGMIYVATTDSVSEWAVTGADKRWWGRNAWA